MTDVTPKQKVSLSLDADLVAEFESDGPLSPQVNAALRAEADRRRRAAALQELVRTLTGTYGPFDRPGDHEAIAGYIESMS